MAEQLYHKQTREALEKTEKTHKKSTEEIKLTTTTYHLSAENHSSLKKNWSR